MRSLGLVCWILSFLKFINLLDEKWTDLLYWGLVNAIPDLPDVDPQTHFAELGDIVVLVLRCVSKKDKPGGDSDSDSDAPRSAMAPCFDLDGMYRSSNVVFSCLTFFHDRLRL